MGRETPKDVVIGDASCGLELGGQNQDVSTGPGLSNQRVQIRKVKYSHEDEE